MKHFIHFVPLLIFDISASDDTEQAPQNIGFFYNSNYTFSDEQYVFTNKFVGCHACEGEALASGDFLSFQWVASLNTDPPTFLSQIRWRMSDSDYNMSLNKKMSDYYIENLEFWITVGYPQ